MHTELDVLRDVAERLERAGIRYMLTGSLALAYYAQPRMTRDIDLVISAEQTDASALVDAFREGYYLSDEDVARALAGKGMFNLLQLESMIKVDLIVRKDEPYRAVEFSRRQRVDLGGVGTWIVSKEDLILSKLVWARDSGSELQRRDVRMLLGSAIDSGYLRQWASALGVDKLLQELAG